VNYHDFIMTRIYRSFVELFKNKLNSGLHLLLEFSQFS